MTKKVITVEDILQLNKQGEKFLSCDKSTIITALAQDKADELGITIGCKKSESLDPQEEISGNIHAQIKQQVLARLPENLHGASLVDSLIEKLLKEGQNPNKFSQKPPQDLKEKESPSVVEADPSSGRAYLDGIIAIDSQKLPFQKFNDAPCPEEIKIIDVVTDKDNSPMGVGYLEWDNASFDWHLDYDEVDIILEGELHIVVNGRKVTGKVGDCIFIPKDTSLTFSAPGKVKFAYVTYPANWS